MDKRNISFLKESKSSLVTPDVDGFVDTVVEAGGICSLFTRERKVSDDVLGVEKEELVGRLVRCFVRSSTRSSSNCILSVLVDTG